MKKIFLLLAPFIHGCSLQSVYIKEGYPQSVPAVFQDSIAHSIFFIGDAGEPLPHGNEKTLSILTSQASVNSSDSTVIFLGDNIYPKGLPDSADSERSEVEAEIRQRFYTT